MKVTEFYGNSSTLLGYYKILNVDSCSAECVGGGPHIFAEKQKFYGNLVLLIEKKNLLTG